MKPGRSDLQLNLYCPHKRNEPVQLSLKQGKDDACSSQMGNLQPCPLNLGCITLALRRSATAPEHKLYSLGLGFRGVGVLGGVDLSQSVLSCHRPR